MSGKSYRGKKISIRSSRGASSVRRKVAVTLRCACQTLAKHRAGLKPCQVRRSCCQAMRCKAMANSQARGAAGGEAHCRARRKVRT